MSIEFCKGQQKMHLAVESFVTGLGFCSNCNLVCCSVSVSNIQSCLADGKLIDRFYDQLLFYRLKNVTKLSRIQKVANVCHKQFIKPSWLIKACLKIAINNDQLILKLVGTYAQEQICWRGDGIGGALVCKRNIQLQLWHLVWILPD